MRSVILSGSGLQCALGTTLPECTHAMFTGQVNTRRVQLNALAEPTSMLWYGIDTAEAPGSETRFYSILQQTVVEAIQASGLTPDEQKRAAVFLGSSSFEVGVAESRYREAFAANPGEAYPLPVVSYGHLLARLRSELDLSGEDFTLGTACAASANALLSATRLLQLDQADHAIVIGLELYNLATLAGFQSLQLVADDAVRPFDLQRGGMILGESCAVTVLSARDTTLKSDIVLRSGASLCDTSSVTATNTDGVSIASVIAGALRAAGLSFEDINVIKAHGTASLANDQAEASGLLQIAGQNYGMPLITAVKPFTGHTLGACGVTECVLLNEMIKRRQLPSTPGFTQTDPLLGIVPVSQTVSLADSGNCMLNYFGFGGNNSVLVLGYG